MPGDERAAAALRSGLLIPVSYRNEWQDGLGARVWKMGCAICDPVLPATTAYSGEKVPTSVLIHDIIDHFVSGFGHSGHRNEAKATLPIIPHSSPSTSPVTPHWMFQP